MAYHWRIHHLIFYKGLMNPNIPSSTCNTSKIISYMSSYAKNKSSISGNFSGRCLFMKCSSLFIQNIQFYKVMQNIYFLHMQNYVLRKYMFLHVQKYLPCTKHIVLHMQNIWFCKCIWFCTQHTLTV